MLAETGGRGQGEAPKVPEAQNPRQPDQAVLEKRERRKAYQREWQRQRYQQNPEPKREAVRRRYQQKRESILERRREQYQQNKEAINARRREQRKQKKEAKSEGGETVVFPNP
jgi:hypothetical protein